MYINDIVRDMGSNIRLFADDTSLFIIVDNPVTAADSLNTDLNKISQWAATWLKKVKVSHSLIAVGAVGVRVPLYLGHS